MRHRKLRPRCCAATTMASTRAISRRPRCSPQSRPISSLLAAKALAAIQGRGFVVPDDVKSLVRPVYRHRIILKPEAEIEGLNADTAMTRILAKIEVPR